MAKQEARTRLLILPDAGREAVATLIAEVRHDLLLKIYSLTDTVLVESLLQAHGRGVRVRVMLNSERADHSRDNDVAAARLKAGGVAVRWGSERLSATHEKSMVMDGESALVASFNFGAKYFEATRDFGVVTRDPVQVAEIAACFEADWEDRVFEPSGDSGLLWAPGTARRQVAAAMAGACKTIHLQHAKLVDSTVLLELIEAVRRGVKVRFLCAGGHGLHSWDRPETFAALRILLDAGGKVRRMRDPKPHGNLTLVDGSLAQVGSMHFHHVANDQRRELSVEVAEEAVVTALAERFRADWKAAKRFLPPDPIRHGDTDPVDGEIFRM